MKKKHKIWLSVVLMTFVLLCSFTLYQNVFAEVKGTGLITGYNVYVRNEAGTSGTYKLTSLDWGHPVEIIGDTTVDGEVWYQVVCTVNGQEYTGWTIGKYMEVNLENHDYASKLREAGFPESYIAPLVSLHEKYPSWTFEAVKTGIDWNYAVEQESRLGWNMVQNSADDSRKSIATGAYNWYTNEWTILDGSSWVGASSEYIAYCMDPRNFLDEESVFQFERLSYSQNYSKAGVDAILQNTFMKNPVQDSDGTTLNYSDAFMAIGKETGVSPYHLAGRVKQEQGLSGSSMMISGTYNGYEGYYNYFNFGAYGVTTDKVVQNGLAYAKTKGWNTRYQSLLGGAKLLAQSYIAKGQDTLYFQKFNVVNKSALFSHQYMANVSAAITEGRSSAKGYTDKNQAFVFRIPVYENMPDTKVSFTDKGNPNNYLKSLSVNGFSLTPAFKGSTTNYSLVVEASVNTVEISATGVVATSTVHGTGSYTLQPGKNTITVVCKAENGTERTYTITIAKEKGEETQGHISTEKYEMGEQITKVSQGTSAEEFLAGFLVENYQLKLLDSNGTEVAGNVATGYQLGIYQNEIQVKTYDIVVTGDVNGDGKVGMADLVRVNQHILGIKTLEGIQKSAADVNHSGGDISMADLVLVNRCILGIVTL